MEKMTGMISVGCTKNGQGTLKYHLTKSYSAGLLVRSRPWREQLRSLTKDRLLGRKGGARIETRLMRASQMWTILIELIWRRMEVLARDASLLNTPLTLPVSSVCG